MSLEAQVTKLEAVVRLIQANAGGGGGDEGGQSPASQAWDAFYSASVTPFIEACNAEESTKKIGTWTETAWKHAGLVVQAVSECAKPSQEDFLKYLDPVVQVITAAQDVDNKSASFNQDKAFAEIVQSLSFVMMDMTGPHITGQLEAADFYLNKVLTSVKDKPDPEKANGRNWVKTVKAMLKDMADWAKQFCKSGFIWKFKGANILEWTPGAGGVQTEQKEASVEDRLAELTQKLAAFAASMSEDLEGEGEPARVTDWNEFYESHVAPFIAACSASDGTKQLGEWTEKSFQHMGKVVVASAKHKKPSDQALMKFLGPIVEVVNASSNPARGDFFNQGKSFAECIMAHNWVVTSPAKAYVTGQLEAADFYLMKVLTSVKDKDDAEKKAGRDYVKTLKTLMNELANYVFKHFKTGLEWNPKGEELKV
jgi:small nuclear ribonucleoprotein (snRNP)-like protein